MLTVQRASGGTLAALLMAALLCGCASQLGVWDVGAVPAHGPDVVELRYPDSSASFGAKREQVLVLQDVVRNLAGTARVSFDHLLLTDEIELNARAGLNKAGRSFVSITAGMLEFLEGDVDALAALMGHELGHLALKHREERQSDPRAKSDALAFSRHQERQADEFGIRTAFAAGYDPQGVLRLNRRMQERASRGRYLQTHPSLLEREADMYRLVSGYTRAAEGSKAVRLWSLIGLDLEHKPDGLLVRRLGAGSTGNLMPGDRIVALEAPVETALFDLDDVLKLVAPGRASQSFRFSVIRRDTRMPAYFHSRKRP